MKSEYLIFKAGYTMVELMVTVLIATIIATTLGVLFANLLTLHEQEREEAYIRENLVDVVGNLADSMSIGTFATNRCDILYQTETGGVSLETSRVARVTQLKLRNLEDNSNDSQGDTLCVNVWAYENGVINTNKCQHTFRGDNTPLIALNSLKELKIIDNKIDVYYSIIPLGGMNDESTALWNLKIVAEYGFKNRKGLEKWKIHAGNWNGSGEREDPVVVERIVRLWNHD